MNRSEIKLWAKQKIKTNFWLVLVTIFVASLLTNLSFSYVHFEDDGIRTTYYTFGWIFYFVEVGLASFMVKFINDEKIEFNDIFKYSSDFWRCLGAGLLQALFVVLWSLLLIVPGIIKLIAYSLVPYLLADPRYKDMKLTDVLKKSEEMMYGHKWDLVVMGLSFFGWHLLAILTLGILEIWLIPYQQTATSKFLNDIKVNFEGPLEKDDKKTSKETKYCSECGSKVTKGAKFCDSCGKKL